MRKILEKRILSLVSLLLVLFSISMPALAMSGEEQTLTAYYERAGLQSVMVDPNEVVYVYSYLSSYVGLKRTFAINTSSSSQRGAINVFLYNPDGKLVSGDWTVGCNEAVAWELFLPSSGKWTIKLFGNGTDDPVRVAFGWVYE
ncbi:MAG: hypothetical protein HFJ54_08360 [Clostridia bacterium]|nr:hypothetical protein [Clostridia bacterium]